MPPLRLALLAPIFLLAMLWGCSALSFDGSTFHPLAGLLVVGFAAGVIEWIRPWSGALLGFAALFLGLLFGGSRLSRATREIGKPISPICQRQHFMEIELPSKTSGIKSSKSQLQSIVAGE